MTETKQPTKYSAGKIYTIRNRKDDTQIYVGSTIMPLSMCLGCHKRDWRNKVNISCDEYVVDIDDWYIELYEYFPCNTKAELEKREGEVTRQIGNLNKKIAGRTKKEHYEEEKEDILSNNRQYYHENRDAILARQKETRDKTTPFEKTKQRTINLLKRDPLYRTKIKQSTLDKYEINLEELQLD